MGGMSGDEPQQKETWLYDGNKAPMCVQMPPVLKGRHHGV